MRILDLSKNLARTLVTSIRGIGRKKTRQIASKKDGTENIFVRLLLHVLVAMTTVMVGGTNLLGLIRKRLPRAWFPLRFDLRLANNSDKVEQEIVRFIPVGTPVAQAKKIMERNGFKCEYVVNGTFVRIRPPEPGSSAVGETVLHNADFLSCHKTSAFILVEESWTCACEHKDGYVTHIFASTWMTGP